MDLAGAGARRAAWNVALLRDGLAHAYTQALLAVSAQTGPGPALAHLFPTLAVPEPWGHLVRGFYATLAACPLVWCDAQGGRWLPPTKVCDPSLDLCLLGSGRA